MGFVHKCSPLLHLSPTLLASIIIFIPMPTCRSYVASWMAAGVAAQYLSVHPTASPEDVKRALVDWATPDTVMMAGDAAPARLLYANVSEPQRAASGGNGTAAAGGGGGVSGGAIAGIAVGAAAGTG